MKAEGREAAGKRVGSPMNGTTHRQIRHERDLETALAQTRADLAAGRFVIESPEAHVARLKAPLKRTAKRLGKPDKPSQP